tara:strand:- start:3462 stop:4787 length:1326 start_codon:yes stop_codon:yes gene_type:complete
MKKIILFTIILLYSHCSFDNKTGIWENSNSVDKKKINRFKDFDTLYTKEKTFNEVLKPKDNLTLLLDPIKISKTWQDKFYQETNNIENFGFKNQNEILFKSKRLSSSLINNNILFDGENLIISNVKGDIIVYSITEKNIIFKYNFYKKKFKKIKKNLNTIIEKNILYVSDNLGYVYALDYLNTNLLWAKNYKIPFRSNIKIYGEKIITANQDNTLYILNKFNGIQSKFIPTEETTVKNDFINSLAIKGNSLIFLNTFGSIYSINNENLRINWFSNLKQSFDLNPTNLFYANPVIASKDKIILSTDPYLYVLNSTNGAISFKKSITSIVKPIISGDNLFIITKDNLLVCIDLNTKKMIYSIDIKREIASFLETKVKSINILTLSLANNKLLIFLDNSRLITLNKNSKIEKIDKLKDKINSQPIFVENSLLFLSKNNKLIIIN